MKNRNLFRSTAAVLAFFSLFLLACSEQSAHEHSLAEAVAESSTVTEYTCSMHPDVRSTDPDEPCPICGMELIPVSRDEGTADEEDQSISFSPRALAQMQVQVSPVLVSDAVEEIELQGTVAWDTRHLKALTAWSAGRIEKLYVDEVGEYVEQGEVIAELYSPELLSAQQEYLDAIRLINNERLSTGLRAAAEDTLRAAEQRLILLGIPQADIERLSSRQRKVNTVPIYAPVSGIVLEANATLGQYVERGYLMARIASPDHVWIELDVYPSQQQSIEVGQQVQIQAPQAESPLEGTVTLLNPAIDGIRRALIARVELADSVNDLRVGDFVYGHLQSMHSNRLLVPKSAVLFTGERSWVYLQNPQSNARYEGKEVRLGKALGEFYEVRSGLSAGDLVVTRGAFKIDSEMQLRGKASMMSRMDSAQDMEQRMEREAHMHTADEAHGVAIESLMEHYFAMWEALHTDSLEAWQHAAMAFYPAVEAIDWPAELAQQQENLLKGAGHAHHVSNLETARDHFFYQSLALIQLAQQQSVSVEAHIAYCPMARNGAGAEWLQPHRELRNPYFGAMMLRCGEMRAQVGGEGEES